MIKLLRKMILLLCLAAVTTACGAFSNSEPTPIPLPATPTPTTPPTKTPLPAATVTPIPTLVYEIAATTKPEWLNLRAGPSPLHGILGTFPEDSAVTIVGRAKGDDWLQVTTANGKTGWMSTVHLLFLNNLDNVPIVEINDSFNIKGQVVDLNDQPIEGISIALLPSKGDPNARINTSSGEDGYFYAYVPINSYTSWEAQVVGVRCSSRIADANCQVSNHFSIKKQTELVLPQLDPIYFVYQQANAHITGVVKNVYGEPAEGVRVFARRTTDNAEAWVTSQANGLFSLPAADGPWEVYAVLLDPYIEGPVVPVTVTASQSPEPLELQRP